MRIAFTGNHRRTIIFAEIAHHLTALGHEVFWIATGSHEMSSILAPFDNILTIDRSEKGSLENFEKYSDITVNGIIASDRILKDIPYEKAKSYIASCYTQIKRFLSDNNIEIVFGEVTWAHEMVTSGVCCDLNIPFLSPVTIRYPSERFAFFKGIFQSEIVKTSSHVDLAEGLKLFDRFMNEGSSPFYMDRVEKPLLGKLIFHIKRHMTGDTADLTVPSIYSLIRKQLRKCFAHKPLFVKPSGRFIYLPLQCSPESSIDVQAGYYSDQLSFVRAVARSIPEDIKLYVKPHPLGDYNRRFYKELRKIPAVEMVNDESSYLIDNAYAVISISSTACYEAGLCGIPAVVFADVFYSELPTVKRCYSLEELPETLQQAVDAYTEDNVVKTFLSKVYSVSYSGYCESPDVYADALSTSNIYNVSKAFEDVVSYYSPSKSATAASI